MGYRHTRDEILAGALETAFADGLSRLTFGRVARRLGTSDRVVVYYFPSKDDLVGEVLVAMGLHLQAAIAPAFTERAADHLELARRAWPILTRPDADPVFALFFEANGLAATGLEPYRTLVPQLVDAWVTWAAELLEGSRARRLAEAETAIALLDGLLLLRQLRSPAAAQRAAQRLGITTGRRRRS